MLGLLCLCVRISANKIVLLLEARITVPHEYLPLHRDCTTAKPPWHLAASAAISRKALRSHYTYRWNWCCSKNTVTTELFQTDIAVNNDREELVLQSVKHINLLISHFTSFRYLSYYHECKSKYLYTTTRNVLCRAWQTVASSERNSWLSWSAKKYQCWKVKVFWKRYGTPRWPWAFHMKKKQEWLGGIKYVLFYQVEQVPGCHNTSYALTLRTYNAQDAKLSA